MGPSPGVLYQLEIGRKTDSAKQIKENMAKKKVEYGVIEPR